MAHNPIFQTECKITIDGISYEGEVIDYKENDFTQNFTNNNRNKNSQKANEMNDILKNLFHL